MSRKRRDRQRAKKRLREQQEKKLAAEPPVPDAVREGQIAPVQATEVQHPNPRRDAELERLAMLGAWPIKEEYKGPMVNRQIAIAIDPTLAPRDQTAAFRAVLAADEHNRKMVQGENGQQSVNVNVNVGVQAQLNISREEWAKLDPAERVRRFRELASKKVE